MALGNVVSSCDALVLGINLDWVSMLGFLNKKQKKLVGIHWSDLGRYKDNFFRHLGVIHHFTSHFVSPFHLEIDWDKILNKNWSIDQIGTLEIIA